MSVGVAMGGVTSSQSLRVFYCFVWVSSICWVFWLLQFFYRLVFDSRQNVQGTMQDFLLGPSISVTARRTHLYEDAFSVLASADLRKKLRVRLINEQGLEESGIDGGGLFREFLSETLKKGFDPQKGYFCLTTDRLFYPNPNVRGYEKSLCDTY